MLCRSFGGLIINHQLGVRRRFGGALATAIAVRTHVCVGNFQLHGRQRSGLLSSMVKRESGQVGGGRSVVMGTGEAAAAVTAEAGGGGLEVIKDDQPAGVGADNGVVVAAEQSSALQKEGGGEESSAASTVDHGFTRPEMYTKSLVGSVSHYERHVFLCYKGPESWPAQVEAADFDRLPRHLIAALRAHKNDMPKKTRLTICEGRDGTDSSTGDVLIFPDMLRYRGLTHFDVDSFVDDVLVKGKEWVGSKPEPLDGSYIFVCAHGSRDARCGVCGPVLIEKLQHEIKLRGLERQIFVQPCSHIGGHKYAGNLIVFSSSDMGIVSGHWYGYVVPDDVPVILDQHIGKGEIIDRLWRGQMGINEADQKQLQQERMQSQQDGNQGCVCIGDQVKSGNGSACCQSRDPDVKENVRRSAEFTQTNGTGEHDGHLILQSSLDADSDDEVKVSRFKIWGSSFLRLPKWAQTWEREDTHAALAVIGAAAAVAVAIHVCKHHSSS